MAFKTGDEIFGAKTVLDKLEHELEPSKVDQISNLNDLVSTKNDVIHELQMQVGAKDLEIRSLKITIVSLSVHLAVTAHEGTHPFRRVIDEED